ncbi:hypothetical protein BH20VER1_BH20VER1_27550 [soil metagenome]
MSRWKSLPRATAIPPVNKADTPELFTSWRADAWRYAVWAAVFLWPLWKAAPDLQLAFRHYSSLPVLRVLLLRSVVTYLTWLVLAAVVMALLAYALQARLNLRAAPAPPAAGVEN